MKKMLFSFCLLFVMGSLSAVPVDSLFCKRAKDGLYPHPTECRAYYLCVLHVTSVHSCPTSLVFNPATNQCDVPSNVAPPCGTKADETL